MKKNYSLTIGEQTSERIKIEIGSASELEEELKMEVRGRDMASGMPRKTVATALTPLTDPPRPLSSPEPRTRMSAAGAMVARLELPKARGADSTFISPRAYDWFFDDVAKQIEACFERPTQPTPRRSRSAAQLTTPEKIVRDAAARAASDATHSYPSPTPSELDAAMGDLAALRTMGPHPEPMGPQPIC